ncbi:MAG: response regulator [Desulfobacterales bacterium]
MKKNIKVLLIEDNPEILNGLQNFLSRKGYEVITAPDGLEGLKHFEAAVKSFALVITDIVIPHVSGLGIIAIIKRKSPETPVIAITGMGEHPEKLAREASADVVLIKPFELTDLKQHIETLLTKKA